MLGTNARRCLSDSMTFDRHFFRVALTAMVAQRVNCQQMSTSMIEHIKALISEDTIAFQTLGSPSVSRQNLRHRSRLTRATLIALIERPCSEDLEPRVGGYSRGELISRTTSVPLDVRY